jgi:uncharacterized membrane protein YdjX (TVP38/TMEM64 family)
MKKYLIDHKYEIIFLLLFLIGIIFLLIVRDNLEILNNRDAFQEYIKGFGALAPLMMILVFIFEVIIAPLPGFVPIISAGFIFGFFYGSIYALIGNVIGSYILFFLARRYGKYLVRKIFNEEKVLKYESIVRRRENLLFATYFFPIFPADMISFAFGLSDVSFKKFAYIIPMGLAVNVLLLNIFGDYLAHLFFYAKWL